MGRGRGGKHRAERKAEDPDARWNAIETDRAAGKSLEAAHERQSEVAEVVAILRRIRERNHFGEMVRRALG